MFRTPAPVKISAKTDERLNNITLSISDKNGSEIVIALYMNGLEIKFKTDFCEVDSSYWFNEITAIDDEYCEYVLYTIHGNDLDEMNISFGFAPSVITELMQSYTSNFSTFTADEIGDEFFLRWTKKCVADINNHGCLDLEGEF